MCRKLITCFGVVHKNYPNKLLTIVSTKEEAFEYVEGIIKLSHIDDYKAWGYFNHIDDLTNPNNWALYAQNRINPSELAPYAIVKCKFNTKGISLAFRVLNSCIPIGCSFDDELEYDNSLKLAVANPEIRAVMDIVGKSKELNPNVPDKISGMLQAIAQIEEDNNVKQ